MDCPRCGLINPDTAQRCDCGYDFESKTVKDAYFNQELPRGIKAYVVFLIIYNVLAAVAALASGAAAVLISGVVWSCLIWWLYTQLIRKKNWARLALAVLTFPLGAVILGSREARLYCLQN